MQIKWRFLKTKINFEFCESFSKKTQSRDGKPVPYNENTMVSSSRGRVSRPVMMLSYLNETAFI